MKRAISHRTLLARINRALETEHKQVHRSRKDGRDEATFGQYYVVDSERGAVTAHHVDLADYAKKLGLLKLHEVLESEKKQ